VDLQTELRQRYDTDDSLRGLGTLDELQEYLSEELSEMKRHSVDPAQADVVDKNPMNILAYYLTGRAPAPEKLNHEWTEGDYPDIDCQCEGTMIRCVSGNKKIEDVVVGEYVFDPDDNTHLIFHVQNRLRKPGEKIYELTWDDGSTTILSENHIVIIDGKEVKTKDLLDCGKTYW